MTGGEFTKQIQNISDEYWETLDAKHYIVIAQNYNINIIIEWEPEINVVCALWNVVGARSIDWKVIGHIMKKKIEERVYYYDNKYWKFT